uniref:RING-type domain-containing protein n=1 Tax=Strongyloides venezuelensis TaxID=75913 RepID=A0A0K0F2V0_STRVS
MSLDCIICTKPYDNEEHALFSTKYGHAMGKSCLEKFKCPVCRELLLISDCHQIFNLPIKLLKSESEDFVIETGKKGAYKKFIKYFDVHNGYILIDIFYCSDFGNVEYDRDTALFTFFYTISNGTNIFSLIVPYLTVKMFSFF